MLLHGIPTNSLLWMNVIPQLAKQYTVIAPDMLGYGLSGRAAKEELTLPMQAQHIVSLRYPTAPEFEPSPYFIERMIREGVFYQQMVTPEIYRAV
ncbi:alpha/beta hydrolase [Bacillus atrophaeus]|nr:alpha/beta hydrolase [Bacillus atrophaeus]